MAYEATLIWSGEHRAWWRPPANGYTADLFAAGVYDRDEAERRTAHCGPEKRIELQSADEALRAHLLDFADIHPDCVFHRLLIVRLRSDGSSGPASEQDLQGKE